MFSTLSNVFEWMQVLSFVLFSAIMCALVHTHMFLGGADGAVADVLTRSHEIYIIVVDIKTSNNYFRGAFS